MRDRKQDFIIEINKLLIDFFCIPKRESPLPPPLDMLLATILSQNTNDQNSFKAYTNLKNKYKDWNQLISADVSEIENEIRIAGLTKQKAKALKEAVTFIKEKYGFNELKKIGLKDNLDAIAELTQINGVGVKTASCLLLFSLNKDVCPVDTHVFRTVNRIGIVSSSNRDKTFFQLNENFPTDIAHSFHTNLIRLGREVCKPKNPSCGICPLLNKCNYDKKDKTKTTVSKERSFMLLDNV